MSGLRSRRRAPTGSAKEMAAKGVLVETNLTSNADILGVSGKDHPFPLYPRAGRALDGR